MTAQGYEAQQWPDLSLSVPKAVLLLLCPLPPSSTLPWEPSRPTATPRGTLEFLAPGWLRRRDPGQAERLCSPQCAPTKQPLRLDTLGQSSTQKSFGFNGSSGRWLGWGGWGELASGTPKGDVLQPGGREDDVPVPALWGPSTPHSLHSPPC